LRKSPGLSPVHAGLAARPTLTHYEAEMEKTDRLLGIKVPGVAHTFRRSLSECMRPWESARRHAKERHVCATRGVEWGSTNSATTKSERTNRECP
jgi:hypothetical protein